MTYRIAIKIAQAFAAGLGIDLSQRILDHWIDLATDKVAFLEWLK